MHVTPLAHTHVLAAVIKDDAARLLICKRPAHKRHGNLWEFPGGKLELGESALQAARRELLEELGLTVESVHELLFSVHDPGSVFIIDFYRVVAPGTPVPTEHSDIAWVRPEDLLSYDLAPSDERFARALAERSTC
jgi:8-oxo-dGTP diphosphatase